MNSFCFFMLLHATETPNQTFSCFCTRQKHQMELFRVSAHDRNAKWNFFMLLHTSETPNETFSRFCTRQKGQMKLFRASARVRNTKWNFFALLHTTETPNETFSCCCTRQKHQMKLFHVSAHDRNTIRRKEYALVRVGRTGFIIINQLLFIIQTFILLRYKVCGPPANHFLKGLAFPRSAKVISRKV